MSRLGKRPIVIPKNVELTIKDGVVHAKGPKGAIQIDYDQNISILLKDETVSVENNRSGKEYKAKHGLYWSLINNLIKGVTEGYTKTLDLVGIGYRVQAKGKDLEFSVGFSHPVLVKAPPGIELKVEGNNKVIVSGIDKQAVGQAAANIRSLRAPDPYKGKGIRYSGEYIRKKQGKTVKK